MSINIDRNLNIIIDGTRTGFVAVGAASISGQVKLHAGKGHHETNDGKTTHITEAVGPALWEGHISDLTQDVFVVATGWQSQDTIVIKAPAGTKTRWVRESQKEGLKLSDWVVRQIDDEDFEVKTRDQQRLVVELYESTGTDGMTQWFYRVPGCQPLRAITDIVPFADRETDLAALRQSAINDALSCLASEIVDA